mgnify:FL=1|jgi:phosphohistidine phosphatase
MDCLLMRHGIAVESEEWSGRDDTRPLTDQGKKKVIQVAKGLVAMGLAPSHILTSSFTRAQETAALVRTILCPSVTLTLCKALEPDSSPHHLTPILQTLPEHSVVLCVGHEPSLGALAGYLLNGKISQSYPFKKAGAGLIYLPSPTHAGEGVLRWWCTPAQLRVLGRTEEENEP